MRWQAQTHGAHGRDDGNDAGAPALPGLRHAGLSEAGRRDAERRRTARTPQFAGMTFHEVQARSVLNRVPEASAMPFRWTVNPYRGCTHACRYCYARSTHEYLDLDAGADFDQQIVVKTNAPDVLRVELSRPTWTRESVALGTNTDPYQRAEGRYRLMPGIIAALADTGTPFSILTKGTLLARDVPELATAAQSVPVGVGVSLATLDSRLAATVEPGTPAPAARLALIERLRTAGADVHVMAMPLLPWLSDSDAQLDALMRAVRAAGASSVLAGALHLRPGARQWYMQWLRHEHPHLVDGYERLYARSSYAPASYRSSLTRRARAAAAAHGLRWGGAHRIRSDDAPRHGTRGSHADVATTRAEHRRSGSSASASAPARQAALF